jgi:hypothetical protein
VHTVRSNGRVRQEHVASLGSIELPLSVAGRLAFWKRLHERLHKLSNRVEPAMILGAVHERVPMVTPDEQRALQLENAEADAKLWEGLHELHAEQASGYREHVKIAP